MLLSLTLISAIAGAILAGVYMLTEQPIAASKAATLQNAIRAVVPEFDNQPIEEAFMAATSEGDSLKIYPAKMGGQLVGAAVESNTQKGFSGEIKVIVGFDAGGKLFNYSVLQHAETPGLGSKMQDWFRLEGTDRNVLGSDLSQGPLRVKKDGGTVDAITAATISSRAFLDAVNRAYSAFSGTGTADAVSGATAEMAGQSNEEKEGGNDHE